MKPATKHVAKRSRFADSPVRPSTRPAVSTRRGPSLAAAFSLFAGLGSLGGCAKVTDSPVTTGTGGVTTPGTGGTATGGKTGGGTGGVTDPGGTGGAITMSQPDGGCMSAKVVFEPKIPTVFVLADRSGSMFKPLNPSMANSPTAWSSLKEGVLSVIMSLQDQVRFGFGAFTGEIGPNCLMFDKVNVINATDFGDPTKRMAKYTEIQTLYNKLAAPTKGETPTMVTLQMVKDLLVADKAPGDKYVLYVTDGEPDFCDDGDAVCPVDSVVWALQDLKLANISTIIFGVKAMASTISDASLQGFANAGAGLPVPLPAMGTQVFQPMNIYYNCNGVMPWAQQYAKIGKTAAGLDALGTYNVPSDGGVINVKNAPVYRPDPADKTALVNQLATVVAGVKSCVFDLDGKIKVNLANAEQLAGAKVLIEGASQPKNDANGWKMNTETQLELTGTACELWRKPASKNIDFQFPCEIIIPG